MKEGEARLEQFSPGLKPQASSLKSILRRRLFSRVAALAPAMRRRRAFAAICMLLVFASAAEESVATCANLVYAGVKSAHCFSDEFLRLVALETGIRTSRRSRLVRLLSDELYEYRFAIMSGKGAFSLSKGEVERLREYLFAGGFLLASAGCSEKAWDTSFRREIRRVLPEHSWERLPFSHPVFHTVFDVDGLVTKHGASAYLEGVVVEGRLVLVYSKEGLNDTAHKEGCCCCGGDEIANALQVNTNILAYALARGSARRVLPAAGTPPVREAAVEALAAVPGRAALETMLEALASESDVNARTMLITEIGRRREAAALDALLATLEGDGETAGLYEDNRLAAIEAIGGIWRKLSDAQKRRAAEVLGGLFADASWRVRAAVLALAADCEAPALQARAAGLLDDADALVRLAALRLAGDVGYGKASETLVRMFEAGGEERALAIEAIAGGNMPVPPAIEGVLLRSEALEMLEYVRVLSARSGIAATFARSGNLRVAAAAIEAMSLEDASKSVPEARLLALAGSVASEVARLKSLAALVMRLSCGAEARGMFEQAAASDDAATQMIGLSGLLATSGEAGGQGGQPSGRGEYLRRLLAAYEQPPTAESEALYAARRAAAAAVAFSLASGEASRLAGEVSHLTREVSHLTLDAEQMAGIGRFPELARQVLDDLLGERYGATWFAAVLAGIRSGAFEPLLAACRAAQRAYGVNLTPSHVATLCEMAAGNGREQRWAALIIGLACVGRVAERVLPDRLSVSPQEEQAPGPLARLVAAVPADDATALTQAVLVLLRAALAPADDKEVGRMVLDAAAGAAGSADALVRLAAAHVLGWGRPYSFELPVETSGGRYDIDVGEMARLPDARPSLLFSDRVPTPPLEREHKAAIMRLSEDTDARVRTEALIGLLRYGATRPDYSPLVALLESEDTPRALLRRLKQALKEAPRRIPGGFVSAMAKRAASGSEYEEQEWREVANNLPAEDKAAFERAIAAAGRAEAGAPGPDVPPPSRRAREALRATSSPPPPIGRVARDEHQAAGAGREAALALAFFHQKGCRACEDARRLIAALRQQYPQLEVREFDLSERKAMQLNEALAELLGLPNDKRLLAPSVFTATGMLAGREIRLGPLAELVVSAAGRTPAWKLVSEEEQDEASRSISARFRAFGIAAVLAAGLLDGVNPCAFTTIIFLLSYLSLRRRSWAGRRASLRDIALAGGAFTGGVFVTYLLVGLGLLAAVQALSFMPLLSRLLYFGTAGLALLAAALSVVDGVLALAGREHEMLLVLPAALRRRIQASVREDTQAHWLLPAVFAGGMFISLLELACTGQVYAPTIVFMTRLGQTAGLPGDGRLRAYVYLVLYNIMFIAPLVLVWLAALYGVGSGRIGGLFRRRLALVKFLTAGLFAGLAVMMLVM